jgi:hypothetical protein
MTLLQVSRDQVYCQNHSCRKPIVLPHRSPLGKFQALADQPTDEWPAEFLCPVCGRRFVCSVDMIDSAVPVPVPDSLIPDLLRVECECDQSNTATRKTIYTTCPRGANPKGELQRLLRHFLEVSKILSLDAYPYGEQPAS